MVGRGPGPAPMRRGVDQPSWARSRLRNPAETHQKAPPAKEPETDVVRKKAKRNNGIVLGQLFVQAGPRCGEDARGNRCEIGSLETGSGEIRSLHGPDNL